MRKKTENKNRYLLSFILLFFISANFYLYCLSFNTISPNERPSKTDEDLRSSIYISEKFLLDKIYTFQGGIYTLSLTNITFQEDYLYYIKIAVVTPHNATMKVDLIDPQNDIYHLYQSEDYMTFKEYYEFPFGAAISGVYTMNFTKLTGPLLNVHIIILIDDICYREFVSGDSNVAFEVKKFERIPTGKRFRPYYYLKDQWEYEVFICRISAISPYEQYFMHLNHTVGDPKPEIDVFQIYDYELIEYVLNPIKYSFVTAEAGEYFFEFIFYQDVEYVNMMILIVDKGMVASGDGESPLNTTEGSGIIIWVPIEGYLGIGGICGFCAIIAIVILVYKRKSNV